MLVPKGQVIHENLSTSYTHIDQLIKRLQGNRFSGYCQVSFWEYDGIIFFHEGEFSNAIEEIGMRALRVNTGEVAIENILAKAAEKDGELSVSHLPATTVKTLVAAINATSKYEALSTDLTSLDRVIALLKKEQLNGYIEVRLEHEAGEAALFFHEGELIESLLALPDNTMIAESVGIDEIDRRCQTDGAVLNVYESVADGNISEETKASSTTISPRIIKFFETILGQLERVSTVTLKEGSFNSTFKTILPQIADTYTFLDPFIGDFRYVNAVLSFEGEVERHEFLDGMSEVITATLHALLKKAPRKLFLSELSRAVEPILTTYADIIEQFDFERRLPEVFRDYTFMQDNESDAEDGPHDKVTRNVLNLQGVGISEIGAESILKEFYRIITQIAGNYLSDDGRTVQYAQLKKSREYQQYQTAIAFLQQFKLSYLRTSEEQLAFWLNLYNFLIIDGVLKFGVKNSVQEIKHFFTRASYRLGEYVFSLDDIEHGILRDNQRKPYSVFRPFNSADPRRQFCLNSPDVRVHCSFACAAKSAPALQIYTSEHLDEQLDAAVTSYLLHDGIRFDQKKSELWLSRIFYWYRKDFEQQGTSLLNVVLYALREHELGHRIRQSRSPLTLRFMDYDWNLNEK